jgi:hypothetical protein
MVLYLAPPRGNVPDIGRLNMLSACLQLTKAWFAEILSLPPKTFFLFGFPIFSQMSHQMVLIYRLTTLEEPDWDRQFVRQTLDAIALLDQISDKFAFIPAEAGVISDRPEGDIFTRCVRAVKTLKTAWEPHFAQAQVGMVNSGSDTLDALMTENVSFDFADGLNSWFSDIFAPWDVQPI